MCPDRCPYCNQNLEQCGEEETFPPDITSTEQEEITTEVSKMTDKEVDILFRKQEGFIPKHLWPIIMLGYLQRTSWTPKEKMNYKRWKIVKNLIWATRCNKNKEGM